MDIIREGDTVLIFIDEKRKFITRVERGRFTGTDKGFILHDNLVGLPYGSIVKTSMGIPALVLKPLLHDYLAGLVRTTQIIYSKDAALMIYLSGIKPGSRVGEAGIGTGALSVSIASIIGDEGKLYGFDISDKAIETATLNLRNIGLLHRVVLMKRDVKSELDIEPLDAFFLDIPDPWNAITSISRVLKPAAPILIFLPTINQVEKTVLSLRESNAYCDIHVYETLLREYRVEKEAVRPRTRMIGHTGYIVFARKLL